METGRTPSMKVVVAAEGEATRRAAQSLSAHPGVDVALLAPATSTQFRVVDTAAGFDAVLGSERAIRAAVDSGIPVITAGSAEDQPGVEHCSIPGLALALAADLDGPGTIAAAIPGSGGGNETVVFPSPIDARPAHPETLADRTVFVAESDELLAAALAMGRERHRVVLDDHRFMEGIALAAGVGVLLAGSGPGPVWGFAGPYLQTAAEMGLVIGERAA